MYKTAQPLFLICETPLHAGSGSDLGLVDMPIQRERHTGFPKIEGSSLKGAIRSVFDAEVTDEDKKKNRAIFGAESEATDAQSGAIGFTDARLLLFPVKSMRGVFAWVTCPKVVNRFLEDMKLKKEEKQDKSKTPEFKNIEKNTYAPNSGVKLVTSSHVILEEYTIEVKEDKEVTKLGEWLATHVFKSLPSYWQEKVKTDIVVLSDDEFTDFVNLSTEVITRTKISAVTGTVENGALFTEEYLPAESVLYSLVLISDEFKENGEEEGELLSHFSKKLPKVFQLGGNATIGKGMIRTSFYTKKEGDKNESK